MAQTVLRTTPIWLFGKKIDFNIYQGRDDQGNPLSDVQREMSGTTPVRRQKNQIVLHFTAGNSAGSGTITWWNTLAARPKFFCPKWSNTHQEGGPVAGSCPLDAPGPNQNNPLHGKMIPHFGGAHYVLELSQDRHNAADPYTDVVEVVESDTVTWHGEAVNENSVGIEHANVGDNWSAAKHDTFTGAGAAKRPTDGNRWLHSRAVAGATSNLNQAGDYQAYQEEQYLSMILLLRYLCIKHRIARRFFGETTEEKFSRFWHSLPAAQEATMRSRLMRFRGILSHCNCHANKTCCGPAMTRNRLFRGIIDEWWLPVEFDGAERTYYMGPFDPQNNQPSFFRFVGGALEQHLFRNADLDSLQETRSYFDLDRMEYYYAQTERAVEGGTYPVGKNRIWHGGVHLEPKSSNLKVYAAASGTIVAARLGSDSATEKHANFGSQRFVLIRHCLYTDLENDPGGGQRTNFSVDPKYFFTLYMHLAPFANVAAVDNNNPPWFNYWLRHRAAPADANAVFSPMAEVSVGDWLGSCGLFRGKQALHFEVISKEELTAAPWDDAKIRFHDPNSDAICDIPALKNFVTASSGQDIDTMDILRASRDLRPVKAYHKSEWALAGPDALKEVIPNETHRKKIWDDNLKYFMWVTDAVKAYANLANELSDANGMMWHYHPMTFMHFVNERIVKENGQINEPDASNTNVTLEDGYLTRFVNFPAGGGAAVAEAADNQKLRPYDVSDNTYEYSFTRSDLACRGTAPIAHVPPDQPPRATKFYLMLLDFLEGVRRAYGKSINITLAHVCAGHNVASQTALCVLGTASGLQSHADGNAVDIRPGAQNPNECRDLWRAIQAAHATYAANCAEHGGEPSRSDLPEGMCDVRTLAPADILAKLTAGTALSAPEAQRCVFHLEVIHKSRIVLWDCIIRSITTAWQVDITSVSNRADIVAFYNSKAEAEAELPSSIKMGAQIGGVAPPISGQGSQWQCSLRLSTAAMQVRIENGQIIASYGSVVAAEKEKDSGTGNAWPREIEV